MTSLSRREPSIAHSEGQVPVAVADGGASMELVRALFVHFESKPARCSPDAGSWQQLAVEAYPWQSHYCLLPFAT
jgi:hypothetical protein